MQLIELPLLDYYYGNCPDRNEEASIVYMQVFVLQNRFRDLFYRTDTYRYFSTMF